MCSNLSNTGFKMVSHVPQKQTSFLILLDHHVFVHNTFFETFPGYMDEYADYIGDYDENTDVHKYVPSM